MALRPIIDFYEINKIIL